MKNNVLLSTLATTVVTAPQIILVILYLLWHSANLVYQNDVIHQNDVIRRFPITQL